MPLCKSILFALFVFSVLLSSSAEAQVVVLGSGYSCSSAGLLNKKGKLFDQSKGEKSLKRLVKKTKLKKAIAKRNGASKKSVSRYSKKLKGLKAVLNQLADCFSGAVFLPDGITPTPTPDISNPTPTPTNVSPLSLSELVQQIVGDYPNGSYRLAGGGDVYRGAIGASFALDGTVFSGILLPDELLQVFLGSDPVEFSVDTAGKSFPLEFEFPGTPIGRLVIRLEQDLSLTFEAPEVNIGQLAKIAWTGTFTSGIGFKGVLEFIDTDGKTIVSGPLTIQK